jgi:eukaryotic-like serine/threonine-protein kinase
MNDWAEGLRTALAGRYTIERELGHGGMAIVYLAHDVRHERRVALKVLRPELAPSLGGERFLREIRLAAALQHPHILPLYDSGEAGGHLYYVMPYVEGESLRARLEREGPLPVEEAVRYAREVAEALSYAHTHDVVHRDIKPDNILLSGGHALVADFGIARAINAAGGLKLTETGMAVGTPAYMSPEQAMADAHVDGRSDIYALGCVLYEMLAGGPPFTGSSAQAIRARHSTEAVPPLRAVRPMVPEPVEGAIVKALAKTPADRFPTADAFAATLARADSGASISGVRPTRWARFPGAAIAATVVILVALAAWAVWRGAARARSNTHVATSIAVVPLRNLGDSSDAYFADGLTQELTNALTRVARVAPRPFATVAAEATKGGEPVALGHRLGVDYVLDGSMRRSGAHFRVTVELVHVVDGAAAWAPRSYDGSGADVFAMQDSITRQLVGELAGRLAIGASAGVAGRGRSDPVAYDLYLQGQHFLNRVNLDGTEQALVSFGQAIARDSSFADAWVAMASAYSSLAQFSGKAPVELVGPWRQAVNRAIALDSLNGDAYTQRAGLRAVVDWDYDGADRDFRRAIALSPGSADAHLGYAQYLNEVGLNDSALVMMRRAIDLDPINPSFFGANLAYRLIAVGRLEEAAAAARRALTLDSTQWVAHLMLAFVHEREGDNSGAAREAELAHKGLGDVPFVLGDLAYYLGRADRRADAERTLAKLSDIARREYVEGVFLARARLGLGYTEGVLDALEASANARDNDLSWSLALGTFESLRGDPRYEALLQRVGVARFMRRQ